MFVDDMHFVATIVGAVLVITGAPTLMFCIALEVSRNFGDRINPPMPDAMQARMLREVCSYRARQILPKLYADFSPQDGHWSITSHVKGKK